MGYGRAIDESRPPVLALFQPRQERVCTRKAAMSRSSKPGDEEALRRHLVALLEKHQGKVSDVAQALQFAHHRSFCD
jgi:hypothetical protein